MKMEESGIDGAMLNGTLDRIIRKTLDAFALNYSCSDNDAQRQRTDHCAENFMECIAPRNKKPESFWQRYYECKKIEYSNIR